MAKIVTVGDTTWTIPETVNLFDGTDVYIKGEGLPHADGEQMDCALTPSPAVAGVAPLIIESPVLNGVVYFYLPARLGFGGDLGWQASVVDYLSGEEITFGAGKASDGSDFVPVFFYPKTMQGDAGDFNINGVQGLVGDTRTLNMSGLAPGVSGAINSIIRNTEVIHTSLKFGVDLGVPHLISSPVPFKFVEVCPKMVHLFWKRGDTGSINNFWFHVKNYNHSKNELKTVRLPFTDGNHERTLYMPNIEIELTSGEQEAFILKELQAIGSAVWVKRAEWGKGMDDGYPVNVNVTQNGYSPIDDKMGAIELTLTENVSEPANLLV